MSWSFTIENMTQDTELPADLLDSFMLVNEKYPLDMAAAWNLARTLGIRSATLSGSRTESPYNKDEVVVVAVTGLTNSPEFFRTMSNIARQPEQAVPPDAESARLYRERVNEDDLDLDDSGEWDMPDES